MRYNADEGLASPAWIPVLIIKKILKTISVRPDPSSNHIRVSRDLC
jgi:hypothetical protein